MFENKPEVSRIISFDGKSHVHFNFTLSWGHILLLILIPYLSWETYWAYKVGYAFIKWHTHFALYVCLWLLLRFLFQVLNRVFGFKNYLKYQTAIISVCVTLLLLEIVLYLTGIGDTYMEKINYGYASRYNSTHETYYRTHQPFEKLEIKRPEFNYLRQCNSLGFSDIEWTKAKRKNEKRLLCCGDSFTEGVGAPFDSCYVSLLRSFLLQEDTSYSVMNAGIAGNDPCVNFVSYRDQLADYHPDIIIQTLSSNDINTDIAVKGGMERFQKNGTIKFPPAPWWEPIYAISYVSRILFNAYGYNELLIKIPFTQQEKARLDNRTLEVFTIYASEARKNQSKLFIILQPNGKEVFLRNYEYDLNTLVKHFYTLDNVFVYDLLPYYLNEFDKNKVDIRDYYWRKDGHNNSKGYYLMAKGIQNAVDSFDLK